MTQRIFTKLLPEIDRAVWWYATKISRQTYCEPEDAYQELLTRAWISAQEWKRGCSIPLSKWVIAACRCNALYIVRREFVRYRRERFVAAVEEVELSSKIEKSSFEDDVVAQIDCDFLLSSMDLEVATVLRYRSIGLTVRDVSDVTGLTKSTVMNRVRRGTQYIRTHY